MTEVGTKVTMKDWLEGLGNRNTSSESDSVAMGALLRRIGFPKAVVVVGVVYPEGKGQPIDIHSMARMLLKEFGG